MKIAIIVANLPKNGVSTYCINLYNSFKKYISDKTDIFIYENSLLNKNNYNYFLSLGYKIFSRNKNDILLLNTYDIIICINHISYKKTKKDEVLDYCEFLKNDIVKPKKIIIFNEHNFSSSVYNYGYDYIINKNFLLSFDGIVTFGNNTAWSNKLKKLIGIQEFYKRYIQLQHPYNMEKINWVSHKDKKKSIIYIGREASFKHPEQIVYLRNNLDKSWIVEARGMNLSQSILNIPNLKFLFYQNKKTAKTNILSPYTFWITEKYLKNINESYTVNTAPIGLANINNDYSKVWIYGSYNTKELFNNSMKYSLFCCDFFKFKNSSDYSDYIIEYCIFEFISYGIIPVMDYDVGENVYLFKNAKKTNTKFVDIETGVYLKSDLSNINEFKNTIENLYYDSKKYDTFRENCFQYLKYHTDPKAISEKLINDILSKK